MIKEMTQQQFNALAAKIYLARRDNSPVSTHTQRITALYDAMSEAEKTHHLLSVSVFKVGYAHLETV
jgi:hypothetical protein